MLIKEYNSRLISMAAVFSSIVFFFLGFFMLISLNCFFFFFSVICVDDLYYCEWIGVLCFVGSLSLMDATWEIQIHLWYLLFITDTIARGRRSEAFTAVPPHWQKFDLLWGVGLLIIGLSLRCSFILFCYFLHAKQIEMIRTYPRFYKGVSKGSLWPKEGSEVFFKKGISKKKNDTKIQRITHQKENNI